MMKNDNVTAELMQSNHRRQGCAPMRAVRGSSSRRQRLRPSPHVGDTSISQTTAERAIARCGFRERRLFPTQEAAKVLGISDGQLNALGVEPSETGINRYGNEYPLYDRATVVALFDDPRVVKARQRRHGARDWDRIFTEEYGTHAAALPDAADLMDRLNQRAYTAGEETQKKVLRLKVAFVRALYDRHCVSVRRVTTLEECWRCDGAGCLDCGDSGFRLRDAKTLAFVLQVGEQRFCWHLPVSRAPWAEVEEGDWEPETVPADDCVSYSQAYALIEWVLEGLQ